MAASLTVVDVLTGISRHGLGCAVTAFWTSDDGLQFHWLPVLRALFSEWRLTAFVGLALGNVGNLGTHFEYDPLDAAPGRQITAGRAPRRPAAHGCERDANKFVYQRIDIRLTDKLTRVSRLA